jgi:hypothetical protein
MLGTNTTGMSSDESSSNNSKSSTSCEFSADEYFSINPNETVPQSKDRKDGFISNEKYGNIFSPHSVPDLPMGDNPETVGSSKGQRQASKPNDKASWWKNHDALLSEYACQLVPKAATDDAAVFGSNPDRNIADEIICTFSSPLR